MCSKFGCDYLLYLVQQLMIFSSTHLALKSHTCNKGREECIYIQDSKTNKTRDENHATTKPAA